MLGKSKMIKYKRFWLNFIKRKQHLLKTVGAFFTPKGGKILIFSKLFKSRDKPENRTPGSSFSFLFGGSTAGKSVNERSAMQMTAVYACVRILSEAIAGLPLHLTKRLDGGRKIKATATRNFQWLGQALDSF